MVVVGLQVVSRLLMQRPIPWTEEIARVLMIWVMLFGGVVALRRGQHTRITAVIRMLEPRNRRGRRTWGSTSWSLASLGSLPIKSYALILVSMKDLLPASEISGAFVTGPMPLCLLLMMWYLLQTYPDRSPAGLPKSSRMMAITAATTLAALGSVVDSADGRCAPGGRSWSLASS